MERKFFKYMPSEITTNILSRLPIRSVAISKCVCKPWLNLLESVDFVKSHLSQMKTPPALVWLMPMEMKSTRCTILEFEDEDEADVEQQVLHYHPLTSYVIPQNSSMRGIPAYGLLLLHSYDNPIKICNPVTREYIDLCCPKQYKSIWSLGLGFGLSNICGQYKVLCINDDVKFNSCHVYTLGTGTWRRVEVGAASGCIFGYHSHIVCNGNLHWTVNRDTRICGFDLEKEFFSIFSAPSKDGVSVANDVVEDVKLDVLRDCLCYSYTYLDRIVIWLMKEYQVEKSWTVVCKISTEFDYDFKFDFEWDWGYVNIYPIKLFNNGDVLMLFAGKSLIYYSNKTRTTHIAGMLMHATSVNGIVSAMVYTPSLFTFNNLGFKKVMSF